MNDPWVARILYQGAICLVDLDLLVKTKICLRSPVGQDSYPFERLFVKGCGEKTHQLEYVFNGCSTSYVQDWIISNVNG